MWEQLIICEPPTPTNRFFAWLAMPITSCGTTCPGETTRSYFGSITSLFTSTASGVYQRPPDISSTASRGTSPILTTSVRQWCTIIFPYGMSPNMAPHCSALTGTCVPRAGKTSTLTPRAVSMR